MLVIFCCAAFRDITIIMITLNVMKHYFSQFSLILFDFKLRVKHKALRNASKQNVAWVSTLEVPLQVILTFLFTDGVQPKVQNHLQYLYSYNAENYFHVSFSISAPFSAIMIMVAIGLLLMLVGNIDASMTLSPVTPWIFSRGSTTLL